MLSSSSSRGHGLEHHHHHHDQLSHHHQDSLQIKQNDKFFSRLMSKDISMANSSSRVYYRTDASSSVPFMWESRPGTPKHTCNDTTLPPLTPPPSYLSKSGSKTNHNNMSKNMNGTTFLTNVFPRIVVKKRKKKNNVTPSSSWSSKSSSLSSSSSSSSSSSTLSWSSSSCTYSFSCCSRLNNNNNVHYIDHDHDGDQHACHQDHDHLDRGYYPSSTTCFGVKGVKATTFNGSSRGRYSMVRMKNALRSIVGHRLSG